jgi:hypothetical protein
LWLRKPKKRKKRDHNGAHNRKGSTVDEQQAQAHDL